MDVIQISDSDYGIFYKLVLEKQKQNRSQFFTKCTKKVFV